MQISTAKSRLRSAYTYVSGLIRRHPEASLVALVLLISFTAHAVNMFHFPYFENDEAVYLSQAWSVVHMGELAPYTYWYDHAPAGWFLIALWAKLTGGFFTFGMSLHTGRVLMLVLHVFSTFLLYFVTKRLTGSPFAGLVAGLIFALSPLGIHFQRRLLLDNIMVLWTLASAAFLLIRPLRLRHVLLSGGAFALAVLSKETAIFFLPAYVYLLFVVAPKNERLVPIVAWLGLAGALLSLYPAYALIKGEFFPYGSPLGGTLPHVSLIETLGFQSARPGGSLLDPEHSLFWQNLTRWNSHDAFLITGGILSVFVVAIAWVRMRLPLIGFSVLLSLFSFLFLMRGGVVIEFYVIPQVAILALSLGIFFWLLLRLYQRYLSVMPRVLQGGMLLCLLLGYLIFGHTYEGFNLYTADQTKPQRETLAWIREHANPDDYIVTDNYLWLDLNAPENPSGKVFPNAEWYWKVERDPAIKDGMFGNDPALVDYVIQTPQMIIDTRTSDFKLIARILDESRPVLALDNDNWSVIIWGHRTPEKILTRAWRDYREHFIDEAGRVTDPERPGVFTSQAQSYALLRAVWMDDEETFARVYAWTKESLRYENGTFQGVYDPANDSLVSFTDADTDIALALIFAYKQWSVPYYADEANYVLSGIWTQDIEEYAGTPYVSAGNWARHGTGITLNPSYVSPAHYRVFASFDPSRPWSELVSSSYQLLNACTSVGGGVLPPDWCNLDTQTGAFTVSRAPQPVSTDYSIDAFRTPWRIALDHVWFGSPEATVYLSRLSFLGREYARNDLLYASYTHDGEPRDEYEYTAMYAGSLGYFLVTDPDMAKALYETKIEEQFYEDRDRSYWQAKDNYYTQNWAWFGTALYGGVARNLWAS